MSIRNICWPGLLIAVLMPVSVVYSQAPIDIERTTALCTACHRDKFASEAPNPHRLLENPDWQQRTGEALSCLNCHGDVGPHIEAGGGQGNVLAFRNESPTTLNDTCLACHRKDHPRFERSPHALAGLSCATCHSQHHAVVPGPLLQDGTGTEFLAAPGNATRLCMNCHVETANDFAFNERHRLSEGIIECSSCHNPHDPASRVLLGGFKQQQCGTCHLDKEGPFVFEHAASRVEGCTACHSAHGSPNRHMLTHQRVGELCTSCHAAVPQFHSGFSPVGAPRFGLDTQCTNCHSTIHGSNFDPAFLK